MAPYKRSYQHYYVLTYCPWGPTLPTRVTQARDNIVMHSNTSISSPRLPLCVHHSNYLSVLFISGYENPSKETATSYRTRKTAPTSDNGYFGLITENEIWQSARNFLTTYRYNWLRRTIPVSTVAMTSAAIGFVDNWIIRYGIPTYILKKTECNSCSSCS